MILRLDLKFLRLSLLRLALPVLLRLSLPRLLPHKPRASTL
jgi:hypothetical protein